MTLLLMAVLLTGICFTALVAVGRFGQMPEATRDRVPPILPAAPLDSEQLTRVRFSIVARGYRMSEVDEVLALVGLELDANQQKVAELTDQVSELNGQLSASGAVSWSGAPGPSGAAQAIDSASWE
ncbi:MAG: DivIVA domain-containing protein [Actinomycetes bacterium]